MVVSLDEDLLVVFRSPCLWHDMQHATVEVEFQDIPGWAEMRIVQWEGRDCYGTPVPYLQFAARGPTRFTKRNELRTDCEWGPVLFAIDLEKRAVRMRHFPYQITIPDWWHVVQEPIELVPQEER